MSPEKNLEALGLRQLPPTALADESVNRAIVADVNGAHSADAPSPAENPSPHMESNFEAKREAVAGLAIGELAPFVELAKRDPGFPFEADSVVALNRLAKDRRADFERLRSRLKGDTHVRVPALENAMKGSAAGASSDAYNRPGQPIEYDEIDPWDEPVDGAKVLTELADVISAYVIMDAHQRDAVALWAVFTHAHDLFVFAPLLIILSPTKRCGKTRLQEVLAKLAPRPQTMSGVSAAALARLVEEHRPTILIDEFDAAAKGDAEMAESLRGQLNSSFNRSGAYVLKSVPVPGGGWDVRKFSTWAATCVAGIGQVPDTVADRSVVIRLERKIHTQSVRRLRARDGGELHDLARKVARFVADNEKRLRADLPDVPKELNDRARDAWEPLLSIADIAGGEWSIRARGAAITLAGKGEAEAAEGDVKQTLLSDIRDIFVRECPKGHQDHEDKYGPRLATKRLLEELHRLEERNWITWGRARKPMTDVALASLLKSYGIRSGTVRLEDNSTPKGYYLRSFQDAFARYLPLSRHAATTPRKPDGNEDLVAATNGFRGDLEKAGNPSNSAACGGVAAQRSTGGVSGGYGCVPADPDADEDILWRGIGERT
jgi:putative DNA primase/helicase